MVPREAEAFSGADASPLLERERLPIVEVRGTTTACLAPRSATRTRGGEIAAGRPRELLKRYNEIVTGQRMDWTEHYRLIRRLGSGGQGVVYLGERRGTDRFTMPVALKVFSPERYGDERVYAEAMARIAHVAGHVAKVQQDNLLDVHNWVDRHRIRIMEMEWIDGYDLARLLTPWMYDTIRGRVSSRRWEYINQVIITAGPAQPRLKPGIAIAIIRDCLAALGALHREGIVHNDLKPSNIMLKRTGNAKIVDIGSAFDLEDLPLVRICTPSYAAPEVLDAGECTPRSDLASLGYVLIEMLAGMPLFESKTSWRDLLEAKRVLSQRLPRLLPQEVVCNELLMSFCRGLIAPDPMQRFPSAEAADLLKEGAASFHRQLVKGDLASEYDHEIRLWLDTTRSENG
ncbi:MAG: serine/threonine protein kinase [Pirellulales bacterium]|nr:serine/threonine protein kinase [Pirellulales bacterium]